MALTTQRNKEDTTLHHEDRAPSETLLMRDLFVPGGVDLEKMLTTTTTLMVMHMLRRLTQPQLDHEAFVSTCEMAMRFLSLWKHLPWVETEEGGSVRQTVPLPGCFPDVVRQIYSAACQAQHESEENEDA